MKPKQPHEYTPQETFQNAVAWIGEEYMNSVEKVYEKFIEIAGTDDPKEFVKNGYQILTKDLEVNDSQVKREAYILTRGKTRIITAFEVTLRSDLKIVTRSLNVAETKTILGGK